MGKVRFGADGIRGIVGDWPLTPQGSRQIGCALGRFLSARAEHPTALVGRDTRPSGSELASNIGLGLRDFGVNVVDLGIITTPGVACLVRHQRASLGVVVSASHNPREYNGIKLIGPDGLRLRSEAEIEAYIEESMRPNVGPVSGIQSDGYGLLEVYLQEQIDVCPFESFEGLRLVLDCANGATSKTAPPIFARLGAQVSVINNDLMGDAINYRCGSEHAVRHPQDLIRTVRQRGATYGLAFDGDGDRLVVVDSGGAIYNGDDFLFLLAVYFHNESMLRGNAVVTTDMANSGLKEALLKRGIRVVRTEHGDKNLEVEIWGKNYLLGAEQVGNVILNDGHHAAADSVYAALVLIGLAHQHHASLCELATPLKKKPQMLATVPVSSIPPIERILPLQEQRKRSLERLGQGSRILLWRSSTEPGLLKAMVEGGSSSTAELTYQETTVICEVVQSFSKCVGREPEIIDVASRYRLPSPNY